MTDEVERLQNSVNAANDAMKAGTNDAMTAGMNGAQSMGRTMSEMSSSAMGEFTKMLGGMKMPGMLDMEALLAAHRRNLETLSAANRVALEGAQAIARRNMEIMQQTMSELTDGMRHLSTSEPPQARAARQVDMLKAAYERAVSNMQEISGLIQKSNGEALQVLNHRFSEAIDEVKALVTKATQSGA